MPYRLDATDHGAVISLEAKSREEFLRDLVASLLEASYGRAPEGASAGGQVVPLQAAGADEAEILVNLADGTLRAVRETAGVLLPPRWLAFDENRVTVTLPVGAGPARGRFLTACRTSLESPLPALRATVELTSGAGR